MKTQIGKWSKYVKRTVVNSVFRWIYATIDPNATRPCDQNNDYKFPGNVYKGSGFFEHYRIRIVATAVVVCTRVYRYNSMITTYATGYRRVYFDRKTISGIDNATTHNTDYGFQGKKFSETTLEKFQSSYGPKKGQTFRISETGAPRKFYLARRTLAAFRVGTRGFNRH